MTNALLVRVGADLSIGGGSWNGPVDSQSGKFAYVPIPETRPVYAGLQKPYTILEPVLSNFGVMLPPHLKARHMHLDPDFEHLTYGDQGERARQLRSWLRRGDLIVFYAALFDVNSGTQLVYALVGFFVIQDIITTAGVGSAVVGDLQADDP
jgi:putative DNA base modification enzyme with NMAD domain